MRVATALLFGAVALSGAAGLVNQVAWQRALKVFLGGSEAASALVVVLVFLAGLGAGAAYTSRRVTALGNPTRVLSAVEAALLFANLAVCGLLALDPTDTMYAVQRAALGLGVPLRVVYGAAAVVILGVPCLLMGATTPLAAEIYTRGTGTRARLGALFAANTGGSVIGVVLGTAWMLPAFGQANTLLVAATANGLAALVLALPWASGSLEWGSRTAEDGGRRGDGGARASVGGSVPGRAPADRDATVRAPVPPGHDALLAFGLGGASLAYEMYLLRLLPLRHEPLPFTFGAALLGVLLWWSVGAAIAATRVSLSVERALAALAVALVASAPVYLWDTPAPVDGVATLLAFAVTRAPYFAPFVLQGLLFTRIAARASAGDTARGAGGEVGRVYAWNTIGCCVGTGVTTLLGYELPVPMLLAVIVLGVVTLWAREQSVIAGRPRVPWIPAGIAGALAIGGLAVDTSRVSLVERTYASRDGLMEVDAEGNVAWDGLWHSRLSRPDGDAGADGAFGDHVGTRNWLAAAIPWLVHPSARAEAAADTNADDGLDVAVLGLSIGVTASTFARSPTVERVVGYDINEGLARLFRDYPAGTLGVSTNPKVDIRWQDARSGLALDARRYDIVQSQPLYLRQAGSGLLNSLEMMRLVSTRLAPGGVFCLYSNGTPEQALLLRATAARVFAGRASFLDGYLLVLSNEPLDLDANVRARFAASSDKGGDPLLAEARRFPETATADAVLALRDTDLSWDAGPLVTTDDRPLVEYPRRLAAEVAALGLDENLSLAAPGAGFRSGSGR